ncbi:MAG: hypothetical protein PHT54_02015 [Candidatus Nanoarchaeia archaeon]|nr:hypothetical protein [Candidatus Nanoarchaeia archaeon]
MEQKIIIKTVIEILGAPKEHVEETLKKVVEKLKEGFKVRNAKTYEAQETELEKHKLWTAFTEAEIQMENISKITDFCFDFMPSSIEIIEPDELRIKSPEYAELINELLARLHQYDMIVKKLNAENILLKKQIISSSKKQHIQ